MSKEDKTRSDLSHLGSPAMARRFSQVSPRDEIAKFERVPVAELGKSTLRSADAALAAANALNAKLKATLEDAIAEVAELKAQLGARDEALAAALELAQSRAQTVTPTVTAPSPSSVTGVTPRNGATATAAERQRAWRQRQKEKRDAKA